MSAEQALIVVPPVSVADATSNVTTSAVSTTAITDQVIPDAWSRSYVTFVADVGIWLLFSTNSTCSVDATATAAAADVGMYIPADTPTPLWIPESYASYAIDAKGSGQFWAWPSSTPAAG